MGNDSAKNANDGLGAQKERDAQKAIDFEQTLEDADPADALYMMSLYENDVNDMTLQRVKSRVRE